MNRINQIVTNQSAVDSPQLAIDLKMQSIMKLAILGISNLRH